jgi:hypothetical protein
MLVVLAVVSAGCGRIGFDPLVARSDGAELDGASPADATVCQTFSAWSTPQEIAETTVAGMEEFGGQITPDGLTLYFDRHGAGSEILVTRRPDRASAFGTPQSLQLGTSTGDCCATLTPDELELYFERNTGTVCIYRSTRGTTAQPWSTPMQVAPLCASANEGAYLTPDGLSLYYSTDVGGTDLGSLMVTTRASSAATFTTAGSMVNGITATPTKGYPALSADQLSIYFESGASRDLYEASRPSIGAPFGTPMQIPGINSTSTEQDVSITADGLELYFASSRANASERHLYVATRTCM